MISRFSTDRQDNDINLERVPSREGSIVDSGLASNDLAGSGHCSNESMGR